MSSPIARKEALRGLIGEPGEIVRAKVYDRPADLTRQFVERSPFPCLATSTTDRTGDVGARGDPAGFVRSLDERELLLPDRPGNRLADSLRNVLQNPHVALLLVIPGVSDTFRVNSRATIVRAEMWDPARCVSRDELSSSGRILRSIGTSVDADAYHAEHAERYVRREGFSWRSSPW